MKDIEDVIQQILDRLDKIEAEISSIESTIFGLQDAVQDFEFKS